MVYPVGAISDSIGYQDGMNWYGYTSGNPVNRRDPTGLSSTTCSNDPGVCQPPIEEVHVYGSMSGSSWSCEGWVCQDFLRDIFRTQDAQRGQTEPHLFKDIGALIDDPAKFAQCTIDCAAEVFDLSTAAKAGVAASGLNILPAPGKPGGATIGTSPASRFSRWLFGDARFPTRVPAPTITQGLSAKTIKVGTFAGRVVPIVGTAALFPDARALDYCVATCVRPEE